MPYARHNNNNFKLRKPNNEPIIQNYDDVLSYLVTSQDKFNLENAVAVRLFDLEIAGKLKERESTLNRTLTSQEIDEYIAQFYSVDSLKKIQKDVKVVLTEYDQRIKIFKISMLGAWQGFLGNILTAAVAAIIVFISLLINDQSAGVTFYTFYHRCFAPSSTAKLLSN